MYKPDVCMMDVINYNETRAKYTCCRLISVKFETNADIVLICGCLRLDYLQAYMLESRLRL